MSKTASMRFVWRVPFALCVASMAALLGACAHPSPPDPGGAKSWVVENVANKTTQELYADLIAPGVFERSGSKVTGGYTVESGNLRMPDKSDGTLVTVRSADGSLTAFIEKTGTRGVLRVNDKGVSTFTPEPYFDPALDDSLPDPREKVATAPVDSVTEEPKVVDVLLGYSRTAAEQVGGDVNAHALAQIETVNLALRNSLVSNVSLKLVGTQVIENNYPVAGGTLSQLGTIFASGISAFEPDLVYGFFSGHPDDTAAGWAYIGGRNGIGRSHSFTAFRHEIGHNAGSSHCNDNNTNDYRFGYNNGKTATIMCGNSTPYYSTPALTDEHGLPRGNAVTADTARVWRESAQRLSSYAPTFDGERMALVSLGTGHTTYLNLPVDSASEAGFVTLSSAQGPTQLISHPADGSTRLTVKAKDKNGVERDVYLSGMRVKGDCRRTPINAYDVCQYPPESLNLQLEFNPDDNRSLPSGIHNGVLKLQARNRNGTWVKPISVLISVSK
jgi:hypothetical protein